MQTGEIQFAEDNIVLNHYLVEVQQAMRLAADQEAEILLELRSNILECAEGYREGDPELSPKDALELALTDFGSASELGRSYHAVYRRPISLKELALLTAFPLALTPLLGVDWAVFARAPEPEGWSAFGTSAILLAVGALFSRRWRSPVVYVWLTALLALAGSMSFAAFRQLFEPRELLRLATSPGVPQQKVLIPAGEVANYQSLISWWSYLRYGFMIALILFLIYWLLRLARREWTLASLSVLTFLVISPCRLPDTQIMIQAGKNGADATATVTYTGPLISLLNPIQLNSVGALWQIFLVGGLLFSAFAAAFLSLPLDPTRYVAKVQPRRKTEEIEVKLLSYLYAHPRLVRSFAVVTAMMVCLVYYQAVRLLYEHWYLRPTSLISYVVLLSAFVFFPRSVVVLWSKRHS